MSLILMRPGYLPGLAAIKKTLLKTRVLDFILFGSPSRIRTYNLAVNSRPLYH